MKSNNTTKDICLMFTNDAITTYNDMCHEVIDMLLKKHKNKAKIYVPQIFQLRMQKHLNFEEMSELAQTEYEKYIKRISENSFKGQFVFFSEVEKKKYYTEYRQFANDIENHKGVAYEYMWDNDTKKLEYIYPEVQEIMASLLPDNNITYVDGGLQGGVPVGFSYAAIEELIVKTIQSTLKKIRGGSFLRENELKVFIDAAVQDAVEFNMFNYFKQMEANFRMRVEDWSKHIASERDEAKRMMALMEKKQNATFSPQLDEYLLAKIKFDEKKSLEEKEAEFEKQQEELKKQEELKRQEDEMLLTAEQVAAMVGCDTQTVYHRAEKGYKYQRLPLVKKGLTAKRFKKSEVLQYFEKYPPIKRTRTEKRFPKPIDSNYEEKPLLNKYEAAKLINCDHSTIYHRTRKGYNGHKLKTVEVKKGNTTQIMYQKENLLKHFRKYPLTANAKINMK